MMLAAKERLEALTILEKTYPDAKCALDFGSPFELLVATMLSAQCTDRQVNKTTPALFRRADTPEKMASLSFEELCDLIRSCGFYRMKAQHILETSRALQAQYGGEVPADRDALEALPGVGRKTANVVVSNAFGIPAIAVDTHVFRVANRIGLAEASTVEKTEKQLTENIPEEKWSHAHHCLITHGREICAARAPKCGVCPLNGVCDSFLHQENP